MIATTAPPPTSLQDEARGVIVFLERLRMDAKANANAAKDRHERGFWKERSREIYRRSKALRAAI